MLSALQEGKLRAASQDEHGNWQVNIEAKQLILSAFKSGKLTAYDNYVDKDTILPRKFSPEDKIRISPYGSTVRQGAYIASGVVIMPPSFINVGAYIDTGALVDSHVLVGSCAQIGKNVHLSVGVRIGGVLEPITAAPVIVEDDCFIGANCTLVEGVVVKTGAVLAPGVQLSRSIPVFDCVHERRLASDEPIPSHAVVVPGTKPASSPWAKQHGLQTQAAMIVKYRDKDTDAALQLEDALRN